MDVKQKSMSQEDEALLALRQQIDGIDQQIQELINQRALHAQQVAEVKLKAAAEAHGGDLNLAAKQVKFYRPEREAQVMLKVMERNKGPLPDKVMARIIREIMSACLALEKPMQVAYLGPEGTFTQAAAIKHFGQAVVALPQATIANVFNQVELGDADYGVVPVENSTEGMVNHTLDNFIESNLHICGEVELPIHLHLLMQEGDAEPVKICAHQQALAQSRKWLDEHYPNVERVSVSSNAKAARLASEDEQIAAVAGDMAVDLYKLEKVADNIQDYSGNTTRFLIIAKEKVESSGEDKTSIIVRMRNQPGALFKLLEPFNRHGIMLTRIDTRPSRTENWSYVFFIEFEGHNDDAVVKDILRELETQSVMLKLLGSYPKAVL